MFFKVKKKKKFAVSFHIMTLSVATKKVCDNVAPDARYAVCQTGRKNHLQANDEDTSVVLITGLTKFHPPRRMLIGLISTTGKVQWGPPENRSRAPGSVAEC